MIIVGSESRLSVTFRYPRLMPTWLSHYDKCFEELLFLITDQSFLEQLREVNPRRKRDIVVTEGTAANLGGVLCVKDPSYGGIQ